MFIKKWELNCQQTQGQYLEVDVEDEEHRVHNYKQIKVVYINTHYLRIDHLNL